jgi:class 3 adenylate cyclase/tetratricopeptide (TPR) repeat protein
VACSNCGTTNPVGAKFCTECAARLAVACPACGTANGPTAKFCSECATPLIGAGSGMAPIAVAGVIPERRASSPAGAAQAGAPVAERRLVSILFADLVGFTAFAEERDSEDVRDTLTRYFDIATDVIGRYGGIVEKFIGDAVMAVWGAPTAREDDAERAVRAALELVDAVRVLGATISARAGVLTGEAAVTLGATNQGMVAGDLVNTASRLQSAAAPGTVLVGEATQRAASGAIAFEPAGEQTLKGKQAPVAAWRALRVVAERGGRNRSEALEAPFVGRADELRLLKELFHATGREQRARLVSVFGPAGIGKTRLAWEFTKYLDGLVENVWWHDGRSPAYGEGITFWALGEMVRGRCGLLETDDEPTTRAKIGETLATHVPDPEERRWIEPALLALLGIGSGGGSEQLFAAWRTFFERLAASSPVVMVFEDHHYADTGLLDFVDHLLEWSRNVPIYVVTLARPELLEKRPDWGAGKRNFTSIYLEPLSLPAMRELLGGLVPGLPEGAVRAIVERADGIPLYAVETVRMLLAEGRLALEDGVYRPIGDMTTLAVPETLTALIASRLDGLDPADRHLVSDAAALGQSFTLAGLAAVSGVEAAELESRLRALVRRELFTQERDSRSPERGQYAFVQALIREVAYNTLARKDRKARHLAAARFFEGLGSDELAGALAGHYLAAHANAAEGAETDALAGQARIALKAAAERAAALGSHDQAVALIEQALTVTTDPVEEAELLERAGDSAAIAARYDPAEALLRRAVALHRERGDRVGVARATAALGRAQLTGRRTEEALGVLEAAVAELADLRAEPAFVALEGQLARACFLREDHRRAIEVADRVLEAAEHLDLVPILADTLVTKGSALGSIGRLTEGNGVMQIGGRLAEAHGLHTTALRALNNSAAGLAEIDPRAGADAGRAGLALSRRLGQRFWMFSFIGNSAWGGFLTGDWDRALAELRIGLAEEPDPPDRMLLLNNLVTIRAVRGDPVDAEIAEMERLTEGETDPALLGYVIDARGFQALADGRLGEASDVWWRLPEMTPSAAAGYLYLAARPALWGGDSARVKEALERLDATGVHGPVAEIHRATLRAGLAAIDGRSTEALGLYREALRGLHDLGLPWDQALTAIDMASLLDPTEPEVRAAADAARQILVGLGARPFVDRLDAALARQATPSVPAR